jgi:hypothetical protein
VIVIFADLVTPAQDADIVTTVLCCVGSVVTVIVAFVAPAGTTTFAGGTAREGFELVTATVVPPPGAGAVSVTVARNDTPPRTVFRLSVNFESEGAAAGVTVNTEVLVVPLYAAEIVAEVVDVTADVAIANVAALAPCATATAEGTAMALLSLDTETLAPPVGAGAVSVTVPFAGWPPTTTVGFVPSEPSNGVPVAGIQPS